MCTVQRGARPARRRGVCPARRSTPMSLVLSTPARRCARAAGPPRNRLVSGPAATRAARRGRGRGTAAPSPEDRPPATRGS
eukprot:12263920-Alexandrium_andersonii.AAC.1